VREPVALANRKAQVPRTAVVDLPGERLQTQAQRRERIAQLVRRVGDERALALERRDEVVGHLVERAGKPAQLGRAAALGGPRGEITGRQPPGRRVEVIDRPQQPMGQWQRAQRAGQQQHRQSARCEHGDATCDLLARAGRGRFEDNGADRHAAADLRPDHHCRLAPRPRRLWIRCVAFSQQVIACLQGARRRWPRVR